MKIWFFRSSFLFYFYFCDGETVARPKEKLAKNWRKWKWEGDGIIIERKREWAREACENELSYRKISGKRMPDLVTRPKNRFVELWNVTATMYCCNFKVKQGWTILALHLWIRLSRHFDWHTHFYVWHVWHILISVVARVIVVLKNTSVAIGVSAKSIKWQIGPDLFRRSDCIMRVFSCWNTSFSPSSPSPAPCRAFIFGILFCTHCLASLYV